MNFGDNFYVERIKLDAPFENILTKTFRVSTKRQSVHPSACVCVNVYAPYPH